MYASNTTNSFPFGQIPSVWFVSRREHLETHHQELSNLRDKVTKFVGGGNVGALLRAVDSLDQLNEQIRTMEETIESHLSPHTNWFDQYNKNDLIRIRELTSNISSNLQTIAGQMSWGTKTDTQVAYVKRNLYPLLDLIEDTLKWLERGT